MTRNNLEEPEAKYMTRCFELAELGMGSVSPNPLVGSVVVHNGKVVGEGYHRQYGKAHAEVNAINDVIQRYPNNFAEILRQSTIYVNLEPCSHFGKTPPCSDLIIKHEIPHVVIGSPDPFDPVNGKGVLKLRNAGIKVTENFCVEQSNFINRRFFTRITKQRPYFILKWAQTADGYFAPADRSQKWISGPEAKVLTHKWRTEEDAILVGKTTAVSDNPQLNVREWHGRPPLRIVIDKNLELSLSSNLLDQSQPTIIFNALKTEYNGQVKYLEIENFDHYLPQMIAYQLYILDIQSVIIEGGAATLDLFIKADLWDEARIFISDQHWGQGLKGPTLPAENEKVLAVGKDSLHILFNVKP
ncbi:diaminohydroxyphosphoribosylaminopyrimidine deaminase [Arcticibacter pallidicorallinus]|uniref:Riboflavin biosynthesis protein RibD n=1 Tax=Arcticibacter pallidicorallinus TaxID=1259464 RepID=A0A2T0U328_9SPHI|nr:bifunctional diaminohydroxyphosphoribosylaminopyrimidine deaminase/5-amino-6-(5-phosphoribosylamino)uracil reductase RibD [Arcticibacter pallidicorallinus]PRY52324.1 diaminohydroxyphosphoribosylaminopyrimidine deaminase [Arcticibacter pallidicorallinus]